MTRILGFTMCAALLMTTYAWAAMGKEAHPLKAAAGSKAEAHINEGIGIREGSLGRGEEAFYRSRKGRSQVG